MSTKSFSQFISFLMILSPAITVSSFNMPPSTRNAKIRTPRHATSRPDCRLYSSTEQPITRLSSDIFDDPPKRSNGGDSGNLLDRLVGFMPPPPEDQFIMTGDIAVLFLYSFIGHSVDDYVVNSVFESSQSTEKAIQTLDPLQEIVHMQTPVWVDYSASPTVVDQVITMNAKDTLLNQWGPLFTSPGVCTIALCSTWLLAGYLHRAFSFQNSIDCDIPRTLQKTMETWITMMIMMLGLTLGSNTLVNQTPVLQSMLGGHSLDYLLTKDDALFLVDTATILISWRFMANVICQYLR
ncbi:unnamed protein product [Cylindrotheca closterium]|uniref:Uncharacterized protein n=1 Tax=Cylindrotheca closterium TaxID=2856 RepID=A0AAD2CKW5_9STRA|nr:unnamed protein product [Cylindrotheca closterium]